MRIIHVSPYDHPVVGGAELHLQAVSDRLAARGRQVTVLTLRSSKIVTAEPDPSLAEEEDIGGVRVIRFEPDEGLRTRFNRFLRLPGSWRLCRTLMSIDHIPHCATSTATGVAGATGCAHPTRRCGPGSSAAALWLLGTAS